MIHGDTFFQMASCLSISHKLVAHHGLISETYVKRIIQCMGWTAPQSTAAVTLTKCHM